MPVMPWQRIQSPLAENRYVALLSFLPLKHYRALPRFFSFTFQILRQLQQSPGLIGYALDARPFSLCFWTLSAWQDQSFLSEFVDRLPHSNAMQSLAPHMGKTQFVQWWVESHEIPLDWSAAKARLSRP